MNLAPALESVRAYMTSRRRDMAQAYDEATFRHFLMLERERAKYPACSSVLVLVTVTPSSADGNRLSASLARAIFSGLAHCIREVDFIGWYRDGQVAGAVLVQAAEPPAAALRQIADRVAVVTSKRLPARVAQGLDVQVIPLRGGAKC